MKKRILSFKYAFEGLFYLFKTQPNARFHLLATFCVIILGFYCKIENYEWIAILICCGSVISLEAINTAIETLSNKVNQEIDPLIKIVKDVAASSVLIAAITSLVIGAIIFIPKFLILTLK